MDRIPLLAQRVVAARWFEWGIVALILATAAILGLSTSDAMVDRYGALFERANDAILGIFIVEAVVKMVALAPRPQRYFRDGWNVFDFAVIVFALVPASGPFAMVARLARLMRVLRLISTIKELRLIVGALVRSIPSVANVMLLMGIVVYIYAIIGHYFFHESDPEHWRSLGISLLTLFQVVTLEGWNEIMGAAMAHHPWAWAYFVSFVLGGTFVVANIVIAVVINNLDEVKAEQLRELRAPATAQELLAEIRATQAALQRLESQLANEPRDDPRHP